MSDSEENLYQRGGIWWLRATVGGTEFRESLRTCEVKAARRLRDKRLDEIRRQVANPEDNVTWGMAVSAWVDHAIGQIGPKTLLRYDVSLKQCEPFLVSKTVREIGNKTLYSLIDARKRAGAGAATIRRDLTAISRVLEYAESRQWREGNPTLSVRRTIKERRDPIALPEAPEVERIIESSSVRFGALVRAALLTGCRQHELVTAKWRGFNPRAGTLEVIGKGNKLRTIELSDKATAHITAHPRTIKSPLIFCHESGEEFAQPASEFCHVRRAIEAKNKEFRRFRFHDLRHLFAVEALRNGDMDIYTLSMHLGHTSVKTTEIYLKFLTPEQARKAKHGSAQRTAQLRRSIDAEKEEKAV